MSARVSFAVAVVALFAAGGASAQTIYRCGQTYSAVSCPNAKTVAIEGARPTAAERAEARRVAASEKRLGDEMARDRRIAEAARQPSLAASLGPTRIAAVPAPPRAIAKKSSKKRHKAAQPDDGRDFVATVPRVRKTPS